MSVEQNKEIARRYFEEILNTGNLDLVDELFSEDFQFHITTIPVPVQSRDGEKGFVSTLRNAFPDIKFVVDHYIAEGDKVLARWHLTGTHNGPFLGIPPTGNAVEDHGNDIFHFRNGQCTEIWVNEDSLGLMKQMGVIPG